MLWDDVMIDAVAEQVMHLQQQEDTTMPYLNKRLSEVKTSIDNILSAIEQGIFTASTKERLEQLEAQKRDIEAEIAKESIVRPKLTKEQIVFWFHRFRKMDTTLPENRRRIIDSFLNSMVLHDDRIEFYFNFKKGAKTLTLDELQNGSDLLNVLPPKKK